MSPFEGRAAHRHLRVTYRADSSLSHHTLASGFPIAPAPACALPRADGVFEGLGELLVDEFEREAFFEISHHTGLHLAEQYQRFHRRAFFRGDRSARQRHVDDPAGHLAAVLEREQRNRVARYDAVVAAVFRQGEDIAVSKPGQLRRELVALARGGADGHGKAVVDDAGDPALDPADMV